MNESTPAANTKADQISKDVMDLVEAVRQLPAEHLSTVEPMLSRVIESTKRRRRILGLVQDALSQLRLDMKYLVFDLEATRREREDFRAQLEEKE